MLRPYVTLTQPVRLFLLLLLLIRWYFLLLLQEIAEMAAAGVYVAGFTDSALKSKENLYDIYVDSTCPIL